MKLHRLTHMVSEIFVISVLVLPIATVLAALVGFVSWLAHSDVALLAAGIIFGLVVGIVPITIWLSFGPDTTVICERCLMWLKRHIKTNRADMQTERRRHTRYLVNLSATFFNDRVSGLVAIGDVSSGGCRVESNLSITTGDFGQLLIDLPDSTGPLKVSQAMVRWIQGKRYGLEFTRMEPNERGLLSRFISQYDAVS
jgi:hypothetical protein